MSAKISFQLFRGKIYWGKSIYSVATHSDVNLFRINRRYAETSLNGTKKAIGTH